MDLKQPSDREIALEFLDDADVAIIPYRPGVWGDSGRSGMLTTRNRRLIVTRMTGWGQDGPLAHAPGHDINFIALAGALQAIGPPDAPPVVPLNLVGDYAAGGLMLAFGTVCALYERSGSGIGQVIDVAMVTAWPA